MFNLETQSYIPCALAAFHNLIIKYDLKDLEEYRKDINPNPGFQPDCDLDLLANCRPNTRETWEATEKQARVADQMWNDYLAYISEDGK